jgi:hypothetical protein
MDGALRIPNWSIRLADPGRLGSRAVLWPFICFLWWGLLNTADRESSQKVIILIKKWNSDQGDGPNSICKSMHWFNTLFLNENINRNWWNAKTDRQN